MNYFYVARSDFSLGQSLLNPKKITYIAKRDNIKTVALCDTMTISGITDMVSACVAQDVNYIIGCRLCVVMNLDYRKPGRSEIAIAKPNPEFYPKVYVKNEQGMFDLMKLLSLANSDESGRFFEKARINLADLIQALKGGNLALSTGDLGSVFLLKEKHYNWQTVMAHIANEIPKDNVFCEVFNANSILFNTYNKNALKCAIQHDFNIITSNLTLYDEQTDAAALDTLSVIVANQKVTDGWRNIQQLTSFYSKSDEVITGEIEELLNRLVGTEFSDARRLIDNQKLINACNYKWQQQPISLPKIVESETQELARLVTEGWRKRIKRPIMGYMPTEDQIPKYKARLAYELTTLKKLGFERYFILVGDLVRWSKSNGIMVGPARGSCFLPGHRVILDKSLVTKPIEQIKIGDTVIAHDGSIQSVIDTMRFDVNENILELEFSNGVRIKCTKDHKFFTKNRGWVTAENLEGSDEFDDVSRIGDEQKFKL